MLPLRGKILNVERARFDKMLSSEQIGMLIIALGTSIGKDEFTPEKLRYHKIIIMTDADVDGAHIRTLLLTFFFRQMPELIERGHVYIAQPPLYKVTKGRSEQYLKNERALEDYLIQQGLDEAALHLEDGEVRAGVDLDHLVQDARQVAQILNGIHTRYDREIVEQAAIAGGLDPALLESKERALESAQAIAARLDRIADETERGWTGSLGPEGGYLFEREVRGVREVQTIDMALIDSADARKLHSIASRMKDVFAKPSALRRRDVSTDIHGPRSLLDAVFATGRKGIQLQRYKGLGEMNASQLWETTLDPNVRSLLQVKIKEADAADDLFTKLMGDEVEPRREFIQDNALSVVNLDV